MFFSSETQCLRSYSLLYCAKTISLEESWILKHPSTHIYSFWMISFSGRFVIILIFIFIHIFPSQGSLCVDIWLLLNVPLCYLQQSQASWIWTPRLLVAHMWNYQGHWKVDGLRLHASPPVKDQLIYENIFKITKIIYEQNTSGAEW